MESRLDQIERETRYLRTFQRQADDISHLILNTDLPWIDIQLQVEKLRLLAEGMFPKKMDLFERIYMARFNRLWKQWRSEDAEITG